MRTYTAQFPALAVLPQKIFLTADYFQKLSFGVTAASAQCCSRGRLLTVQVGGSVDGAGFGERVFGEWVVG